MRGAIQYVEVNGRTKIAVRGQISEYIPNPTFDVVARPGALEDYFKNGNPEGRSRREIFGKPIPSIPAFREPVARLALMDEMGIAQSLMFPTLGQPRRRTHARRSRNDPRCRPLTEPVVGRDVVVQLPGPHLHRPGHRPAHCRQGDRRARVGCRAGGQGDSHPSGTGSRVPGFTVVRAAGVRPVLEACRRTGRPGHDARVGQRLLALHRRLGRRQQARNFPS